MSTELAESYINRKGLKYRKSGRELILSECPSCGAKGKCSINNATWLFQCFKCDFKGGEWAFKDLFGDVYDHEEIKQAVTRDDIDLSAVRVAEPSHPNEALIRGYQDALQSDAGKQAVQYLGSRGISLKTALACGVGWSPEPPSGGKQTEGGWLILPSFVGWQANGWADYSKLAMIKARSVPPASKQYVRQAGGHTRLFQPHKLNVHETVIVCAGEIDALSVIEAGYANVVATTAGEGAWSDAFSKQLERCQRLIVVYDNDKTGKEGAQKVLDALGAHRCGIFELPKRYNDLNDALVDGWLRDNISSIVDSKIGLERKIVAPSDLLHRMFSAEFASAGTSTGLKSLDKLIGGIRAGEVVVVTGETGSGKSTLVSDLAINLAKQNHGVLFMPLEIGPVRQVEKWARQLSGLLPEEMEESDVQGVRFALDGLPLYLFQHYGDIDPEPLRNTVAFAKQTLGVRTLVVDHIHFGAASSSENERLGLDKMVHACADIANELAVSVIVVAHPNNRGAYEHGDGRVVQMGDIKGSSSIKQVASLILSVHRPRSKDRADAMFDGKYKATVYNLKARSERSKEGACALLFDAKTSTYCDVSEYDFGGLSV